MKLPATLSEHIGRLRVAVYASGGAPSHHLALIAAWGGQPSVIHAEEIAAGGLEAFDAVVFPGGGLLAMAGQLQPLGPDGVARLRSWVEAGGTYIGSCAGSCHPLRMSQPYQEALPISQGLQMCNLTPLNAAAGEWGLDSPGTGRLRIQAEPHPLMQGLEGVFEVVHYNGPLFPAEPGTAGQVLGMGAGFSPFEDSSLQQGYSSTTLQRMVNAGARMAYRQEVGQGQVLLFGSHPEFGSSALQLGWLPAARLLANALGLVPLRGVPQTASSLLDPKSLQQMHQQLGLIQESLNKLLPLGAQLPTQTPPFLGYSGPELWQAAIQEALGLASGLAGWLAQLKSGLWRSTFLLDTAPRANQDFGFAGSLQLLQKAQQMLDQALSLPPERWPAFTGAYNEFLDHPYHLVASVYLSACALVGAAALQAAAFSQLNALPSQGLP